MRKSETSDKPETPETLFHIHNLEIPFHKSDA